MVQPSKCFRGLISGGEIKDEGKYKTPSSQSKAFREDYLLYKLPKERLDSKMKSVCFLLS